MQVLVGKVIARKILDSRGDPTIEVEVEAQDEAGRTLSVGRAAAPSGASIGAYEVAALPKGGVDAAVELIGRIMGPGLIGADCTAQEHIDEMLRRLDGTKRLQRLGGNAIIAVSTAVAKAAASALGLSLHEYLSERKAGELPYPLANVLGGGAHAGKMAPDIQEFLAMPIGASRLLDAISANLRVHKLLRALIEEKDKGFAGGRGDEGAWAPNLNNLEALELVARACEEVSGEVGFEVKPSLDIAAGNLYDPRSRKYTYKREGRRRDAGEQLDFVLDLIKTYDLFYVEDPFQEDDFESFAELTRRVGRRCLICGDDLFATSVERIRKGIEAGAANAVLIKPNQVGTLSDTSEAVKFAKKNRCVPVMSHRSGETTDETIAQLAVGFGCPIIKAGAVGGERVAKLNELLRIEQGMGGRASMGRIGWR